MEDDKEQRPESLLPYEAWTEAALRHVVADAMEHVAEHGLPGGHHFYITFRTDHPGVVMPQRLRAQYPQEMTIVLQHQFWDLHMDQEARLITVGLSFGGVPTTLAIPLDAVIAFADPYVQYGLRFRPAVPEEAAPSEPAGALPPPAPTEQSKETPQVVSLDAFRRRPPSKE
ncbi:MAG: hypothetical protein JO227_12145 [Acetobacteraceae bacterium]|nr:hypothetical protein [Acetobacteraceae bacterium]